MRLKYRIGVMPGPWPAGPDGAEFLWKLVALCEHTDIDSLWFSERLSAPLPVPEPMTTMAAVAARTSRLKFGPSVFVTPFRTPVMAAREIAMIDYLSGGRMLPAFGIGVEQERDDRLLVAEGARPFDLAHRSVLDAVAGHDEQQAVAGANRLDDLGVPVLPRPQPALVEPCRDRGWASFERVTEAQRELLRVGGGVADEVVGGHGLSLDVSAWNKRSCGSYSSLLLIDRKT
jgi:hypothetical protein